MIWMRIVWIHITALAIGTNRECCAIPHLGVTELMVFLLPQRPTQKKSIFNMALPDCK
jgi:hypothetical protein